VPLRSETSADDLLDFGDGIHALERQGDDGTGLHKAGGRVVDLRARAFLKIEVVLSSELGIQVLHLDATIFSAASSKRARM
jgi:hypothetical protein